MAGAIPVATLPWEPRSMEQKAIGELDAIQVFRADRGFGGGLPFVPPSVVQFDATEQARAHLLLSAAITGGTPGATMRASTWGHAMLGHAIATAVVANGRLPYVEQDKSGKGGIAIVQPWTSAAGPTDEHQRRTIEQARKVARILASGRLAPFAPKDGIVYLSDATDDYKMPKPPPLILNPSGAAAVPVGPILITIAVVGAIGVSQYFKADVAKAEATEKTRQIYAEQKTARLFAAMHAALTLEMERQRLQAETGKPIDPSPIAKKAGDALDSALADEPTGSGGIGRVLGGMVLGAGLALGSAYLAREYA